MHSLRVLTHNGFVLLITVFYIAQAKSIDSEFQSEALPKLCGRRFEDSVSSRLAGGVDSKRGRHPWIANIFYDEKNKLPQVPRCAGSILNKKHILTAGHCCFLADNPPVYVRVGELNLSETYDCEVTGKCAYFTQDLKVNMVKPHPRLVVDINYDWAHNDLCLLRLNSSIHFNEYVEPICLPDTDATKDRIGTILEIAGWGDSENGFPDTLQEATHTIISHEECYRQLPPNMKHNSSCEFCAQGETMGSRVGDSGAPLVHREETGVFQVWGVVSYGEEEISKPTVFTDVSKYLQWIEQNIQP